MASHIVSKDVNGVRVKPEELEPVDERTEADRSSQGPATLEPGTVLGGDGKLITYLHESIHAYSMDKYQQLVKR